MQDHTKDEEQDDMIAPDIEDSAFNEENEEILPQKQQTQESENNFQQEQAAAEVEDNWAAPKCLKPKGAHSEHIDCIHCGCAFHIQCVVFIKRRAINENYIYTVCERML